MFVPQTSYIGLAALPQVVGQIVVDVGSEAAAVLWVQPQHIPQSLNVDVL